MLEKVTFLNTYKNSPTFFQEATQPGLQPFRQKVKSRTTFIASREFLPQAPSQPVHISPKKPDVYASE